MMLSSTVNKVIEDDSILEENSAIFTHTRAMIIYGSEFSLNFFGNLWEVNIISTCNIVLQMKGEHVRYHFRSKLFTKFALKI